VKYFEGLNGKLEPIGIDRATKRFSFQEAWSYGIEKLADLLLPKGYPDSVAQGYLRYVSYQATGAIFSCAAGVLSTQSLLFAMGLGAGSLPLAATLNWVIKDGVGMMGGIAFASLVNNRFDSNPRFWRFSAALMNDLSCYVEMLSPLVPQYFLPIACVANIGKNISWLGISASRAGIHNCLALHNNLADVTAKTGSQTTLAAVAGTTLGVFISTAVGENWLLSFFCLSALSTTHLFFQYKSMGKVVINSLNLERLRILLEEYAKSKVIMTPKQVGEKELFFPQFETQSKPKHGILIGQALHEMFPNPQKLKEQLAAFETESYLISVNKKEKTVSLLFEEGCSPKDILKGASHAVLVHMHAFDVPSNCLLPEIWADSSLLHFLGNLKSQGWKTETLFFEDKKVRYSVDCISFQTGIQTKLPKIHV